MVQGSEFRVHGFRFMVSGWNHFGSILIMKGLFKLPNELSIPDCTCTALVPEGTGPAVLSILSALSVNHVFLRERLPCRACPLPPPGSPPPRGGGRLFKHPGGGFSNTVAQHH